MASGRSTGAPLAAAARAGACPAQAKTRVSSPLRKRWQRTPPVARPLAGYSPNGVTLTAPGSVPGSAVDEPDAVTTTGRRAGRARRTRPPTRPRPSRMPAMPPPERPCGRTPSAPKCSSWASEVTKQSVSSPVASSTAPTTSSPSLSGITSHSSRPRDLGVDPLDHALAGAEREPGTVGGERGQGQRPLARLEGEHLAERQPALQVRVVGGGGSARQVEHAELEQPPARGEHADLAAGGGADRGDDHVVVGAAAARARAARRCWCGPAGRWRRGRRSTGRRRPRAARRPR